ncbi:tetratricopeptide repeat protein [Hespellia stercorisuis]|uniref:Tetratricopeptide repeat-containing protein n=1 Tax=Hespellia stercorisuis DSM 15480 TaxID=1121950 RepID=A0A1M6NHR4_9FIRM|nr:tetratricopeptide repeat protein [Hespellia stercorisuis]SHJ95239.1 Tetratricopeptide repeat-containing protein [Hespellia stercorisuis DSM 15480]
MEYEYKQKIIYQSNYWYNDGLRKAGIRDMSGAIASLRRSLQYNRENIAARNLLGLVFYGRGEVVEGLVEWIISKNLKPKDNIANYYLAEIQNSENELQAYNQMVKKFNQCLVYAGQDGEDLAIIQLKKIVVDYPDFLKAHQLLALLYLHTEQYAKARQTLRAARKLDTTNEMTLLYMHELTQLRGKKLREEREKEADTVTYNLGNETIIQPAGSTMKEVASRVVLANILVGLVLGAAVVWFLIVPAVNQSKAEKTNQQIVEYSDKIAAMDAQINAQTTALDEYRSTSDQSEEAAQTAASTSDSYENLMTVVSQYNSASASDADMAATLKNVNRAALGAQGQAQYDSMSGAIFEPLCATLYESALESMATADYPAVIDALSQVTGMIATYSDGQALLNLGVAYAKSGDTENANVCYNKIIESLKDTDVAEQAKKGLDGDTNIGAGATAEDAAAEDTTGTAGSGTANGY